MTTFFLYGPPRIVTLVPLVAALFSHFWAIFLWPCRLAPWQWSCLCHFLSTHRVALCSVSWTDIPLLTSKPVSQQTLSFVLSLKLWSPFPFISQNSVPTRCCADHVNSEPHTGREHRAYFLLLLLKIWFLCSFVSSSRPKTFLIYPTTRLQPETLHFIS